jgi:tetratricopeptide (TPR) repeat protein/nucleoside 2-deoxyribosyltransferase
MARHTLRVFVSATTSDLGAFREFVKDALFKAGMFPVIQQDLPPDHRQLCRALRAQIRDCDAMICLVGRDHGGAPDQPGADRPRSYTQFEYDVARELGIPVYVFMTDDGFVSAGSPPDDDRAAMLQEAHRRDLLKHHKVAFFNTREDLLQGLLSLLPQTDARPRRRAIEYLHRPKKPAYFTGRKAELTQLTEAAKRAEPCLIAMIGIGGQGKTTLVHHWLGREDQDLFEGCFWCTAYRGGFTFDSFLDAALSYALLEQFDRRSLSSIEDRSNAMLRCLSEQSLLIVIDGIERWLRGWTDVMGERQEAETDEQREGSFEGLDDFLRQASSIASGAHVVITTRALPASLDDAACAVIPVHDDPGRMALEGLDDDAAVGLLRQVGLRGEDAQLLHVAQTYAKHPLALTVLGGLLRKKHGGQVARAPHVSPLDPKRGLFDLFEETRQSLPARAASERFLQVASHVLEDPTLEAVAAGLGSTMGATADGRPATTESAAPLDRNASGAELAEVAVMLADWNLLDWDGSAEVIRLHPLTKQFFGNLAEDSPAIHGRLSRWYEQQPIDDRASSLDQTKPRLLAIRHALHAEDRQRCASLAFSPMTPSYSFAKWLLEWGHTATGDDLFGQLAEGATPERRRQFLIARCTMLRQAGRLDRALALLDEAIALFETQAQQLSVPDQEGLAKALMNRGNVNTQRRNLPAALEDLDRAVAILEQVVEAEPGCLATLANAMVNRANALWDIGHLSKALRNYNQACGFYGLVVAAGDTSCIPALADAQMNRAITHADRQDYGLAIQDFQEALMGYERLLTSGHEECRVHRARLRVMHAATLNDMHRHREAAEELDTVAAELQAMVDIGRTDAESLLSRAHTIRAEAKQELGLWPEALELCNKAVGVYRRLVNLGRTNPRGMLARVLLDRARAHYLLGNRPASLHDREEGFALIKFLMQGGQLDIRDIYLPKVVDVIGYMLADDPVACVAILDHAVSDAEEALAGSHATESLQICLRGAVALLRNHEDSLAEAGFATRRLSRLTDQLQAGRIR